MDRRDFIKNGGVAFTGLSIGGITVAQGISGKVQDDFLENDFSKDDFPLLETKIQDLQKKMESGEYTAVSITKLYLDRIEAIDKNGYMLHSVIEVNPDALSIAASMDKERKEGKVRGLLHGIPVLVKDNINTADKMMTTAGSLSLEGSKAQLDAFIVQQLREAGAVLLGKTNLSEWANFRSTRSTSGWSSRGGQTRNPFVLDRTPSGSSSGSGSSVSANLCVVAIGTETDGSIISPASSNGIVGLKPTVGLLSRSGIIPISKTQDTAGPMTRNVTDAAILLGALTGVDSDDSLTNESNGKFKKDYTTFLDANALKGKIIGVEKTFFNGHEGVVGLFKEAVEVLKKQGASIVEIELLKNTRELRASEYLVLLYEFKDGLNQYLSKTNGKVKSLTDVINFNKQQMAKAMPYFKQETLENSDLKGGLESQEYIDALKKSLTSRQMIDDIMAQNKLDAIAGISTGLAGCIDLANGDYGTGFSFSSPAAMSGYPHITIPMGTVFGLPTGFSLMARAYEEGLLLGMAYAYEQASNKRTSPNFLKTLTDK